MEKRKVKADLHNHLNTSSNMKGLFNPAIDIASERLGSGGIFALVNFEDERYEQFSEEKGYERTDLGNALYVPRKDILVIKGQEVPTQDGHLLVLGLEKGVRLKSGESLARTMSEANSNNGIIVADHPFYTAGIGSLLEKAPDFLRYFHAIEGHNGEAAFGFPIGPFPRNANRKAQKFYDKASIDYPHLGMISASDGHSLHELGRSYTVLEMPNYYVGQPDLTKTLANAIMGYGIKNQTVDEKNPNLLISINKPKEHVMKDAKLSALEHSLKLLPSMIRAKIGRQKK